MANDPTQATSESSRSDTPTAPGDPPSPSGSGPGGTPPAGGGAPRPGLLELIVGRWGWSPPPWLRACGRGSLRAGRFGLRNPLVAFGAATIVAALVLGGVSTVRWYKNRPKPVLMSVSTTAPELTEIEATPRPHPLELVFGGSAAPLAQLGKVVKKGVEISPPVEGTWRWEKDTRLVFLPKRDWPVGQELTITLAEKGLVAETVHLESYRLTVATAPFGASFAEAIFYQDPQDPELKKIVATVKFTHVVDAASLEKHVKLRLLTEPPRDQGFKVSYDKLKGQAYIHSDRVAIPLRDTMMEVLLEPGVHALAGGAPTDKPLSRQVRIPGIYNLLRVSSASVQIASDERDEPVQILVVETTEGVSDQDLQARISAHVLPVYHPDQEKDRKRQPFAWTDPSVIGPEILKRGRPLKLALVPNDTGASLLHTFRLQSEVGRYVHILVEKGLRSFGGYLLAESYDATARIPEYPKVLKLASRGAVLSLSGEKTVLAYARDVAGIRFEIARVLPEQLQLLADLNRGTFANPTFYGGITEDHLTELSTEDRALEKLPPGKGQHVPLDLSKYLAGGEGGGGRRFGLFLLRLFTYDPATKSAASSPSDRRLVLVTDLGLIVKDQADRSHEVFVQSIATGDPVAGARVEVVGRNGLTVVSATTDATGRASLPPLAKYARTQTPALYLARKDNDTTFLPYESSERTLNLSRFDVGGVRDDGKPEGLAAYLFSDRGLYRPGEEIRVGLIVKPRDWRRDLHDLPLEATVTDPRGLIVRREKIRLGANGFEELRHSTVETAPTGSYTVSLYILKDDERGALLGSTRVEVREFLPDRMKIRATLSKQSPGGWVSPQGLSARVKLENLFGTPAAGRDVRASLTLVPGSPRFPALRDFHFHDWMSATQSFNERLDDATTGDDGEASFELNLERFAAGTYELRFTAQGFEAQGGRSVTTEASAFVSQLPYIIGFKPDGDLYYVSRGSRRSVELVAVGPQGTRRAVSGLRQALLERRFVSVLTRQGNGTYRYESVRREVTVEERALAIPAAGLTVPLPSGKPGDFALAIRNEKGTEVNRVEFTVAGEANVTRSLEKTSELQIVLKQRDVAPGASIELSIKAPFAGAGLITVERDRVYAHKWFKSATTATVQTIKIPAELEGNGYVSVSFHRDLASPEVFTSPLSYGVVPFTVSRKKRTATISLSAPAVAKPGEPLRLRVSCDRRVKAVVFAVDEGILQVAGYTTPDPLAFFFQKRALEVRTAQILDLVLPERRHLMSAPGGGDESEERKAIARNLNPFKRRHDPPVAYWSGIVEVGPEERELRYDVPDSFNGSLRVMAVAVSPEAVGATETETQVRGDFVITPSAPTFVAPGDEFVLGVGVANNVEGSGKAAAVSLTLRLSKHLEVLSPATVTLKISEKREASASFRVRAKPFLGSASATLVASLGTRSSKLTTDLSVRPAQPYLTTVLVGSVRDGQARVPVSRNLYPEYRTLQAGISALPLALAQGLAGYLEKFPHGCTEQIVSQAVPALVLKGRPELGAAASAEAAVRQVIATLRTRQNSDGAFGLWAANPHVSPLASTYAIQLLIEAKERGFAVPPDMLKTGLSWLRSFATTEGGSLPDERVRAYGLYVLSRAGIVMGGPAAALHKRLERLAGKGTPWQKDLAGIYLAATFKLLRQEKLAAELITRSLFGEEKAEDYENLYDGLSRDAQLLFVIVRHFPEHAKRVSGDGVRALVSGIGAGRYNTFSSAMTILALDAYAGAVSASGGSRTIAEVVAGGARRPLALPAGLFPRAAFSPGARELVFASQGGFEAFYSATLAGFDIDPPARPIREKIEVFREYTDEAGKPIARVQLGDEVSVHIRLRSLGKDTLANLAVVDLLPGGFEVVVQTPAAPDENGGGEESHDDGEGRESHGEDEGGGGEDGEGGGGGSGDDDSPGRGDEGPSGTLSIPIAVQGTTYSPEYGDVREDRVVLYGHARPSVEEFVYRIRATNAGTFLTPPIKAESLYDRGAVSQGTGGKIVVVKE
jgi:alpha-2-macroglobulin